MRPLSSDVGNLAFVEAKSSKAEMHVPYSISVTVFAPCNLSTVSQVADTQAQSRRSKQALSDVSASSAVTLFPKNPAKP
jgi:hypothetical protein